MNRYWSKRIQDIVPYTPGEQPKDQRFIKLNTNECPYPPSPKAVEAIREAAGDSLRLYPDPECVDLRAAIAQREGLEISQVFCGNGSDEILAFAFQAFFDPEREVVFPRITYSFYPVYTDFFGLERREVPMEPDFSSPIDLLCGNNGGVVLANPNAPTGLAVGLDTVEKLLAANPDVVVIVDEAYVDFGADSAAGLVGRYPNLLVVQTASKSTREWTERALREKGFTVLPSQANFLFVSHPGRTGKELLDGLRRRGVLVRWWPIPEIEDWLRISIGTEEEMAALSAALEELA